MLFAKRDSIKRNSTILNFIKKESVKKGFIKEHIKNVLAVLGVILWVGALSPEIFVKPGVGCILDENGQELTAEDAEDFVEAYFYGNMDKSDETKVKIKYKFALLELFE